MKSLLAPLLLGLAALSCSAEGTAEVPPPRTTAADVVGLYGAGAGIAHLELGADGRYEGLVLTGLTMDGCGTFEGAGTSAGTWSLAGDALTFAPEREPADLAVRFAEVRAWPAPAGRLRVVVDDREATLDRLQPYR